MGGRQMRGGKRIETEPKPSSGKVCSLYGNKKKRPTSRLRLQGLVLNPRRPECARACERER